MSRFKTPPFRSLRDLVIRELHKPASLMVWEQDRTEADRLLSAILASEAYVLDRSAHDYLVAMAQGMTRETFYRMLPELEVPFGSVWIEAVHDDDTAEGEGPKEEMTSGALIRETDEGIEVTHVRTLNDVTPWKLLYSGTRVIFARDGGTICERLPIATFNDALGLQDGIPPENLRQGDIIRAIHILGLLALLASVLERPRTFEVEPSRSLSRGESKRQIQAGSVPPERTPTLIRLSRYAEPVPIRTEPEGEGTGGRRAAHWVRGHLFLARNGKMTWRKRHVRGEGVPEPKVRHVTE